MREIQTKKTKYGWDAWITLSPEMIPSSSEDKVLGYCFSVHDCETKELALKRLNEILPTAMWI